MAWLRGGTVAVTNGSTTVVGTNADFAANSRIGDGFIGPDGFNYEIGNVASATVISIIPAYKGATASGAAYAIIPVQGYPKALADAFNNINLQWGTKLAALGTTGNYDVLPLAKGGTGRSDGKAFFSEVGVQAAAASFNSPGMYLGWNASTVGEGHFVVNRGNGTGGFTWRSVNAGNTATGPAMSYSYDGILAVPLELQVPKITGLTTALSVAQGGTGGTTQAAARTGLGLGSAAVAALVGTVSQSGGAVIESNSNVNRWYCKFADGSMLCRGVFTGTPNIANPNGSIYYSSGTMSFAAAFVGIAPQVFPSFTADGFLTWATQKGPAGLTSFAYYLIAPIVTNVSGNLAFFAIGRWN